MGMMGKMREGTHVILWILIVVFVGSLALGGLVGGANIMDYITGSEKYIDAVGIVNGESIKIDQFNNSNFQEIVF